MTSILAQSLGTLWAGRGKQKNKNKEIEIYQEKRLEDQETMIVHNKLQLENLLEQLVMIVMP